MIEFASVTKEYGEKKAVNDISFTIDKGEIVGLLGPNGAGKSTTMNMLTGYCVATSGTITVNGFDITKEPLKAKKSIGYLPENPPLYGNVNKCAVKKYPKFLITSIASTAVINKD